MKSLKKILFFSMLLFFAASCEEGIDSISKVEPGPDESAPQITLNYPGEGTQIQVTEAVTSIDIDFEVTDDIEIGSVTVSVDNNQIASFEEFKDYRRFLQTVTYEELGDGEHTVTIEANDLDGKTTTKTVNFEKLPPYQPKFEGEVFYMPFNGDFMELISQEMATQVGSPGFTENGMSLQAFAGAADSYVTFPTEGLVGDAFAVTFWYKLNADPEKAGLISISPEGEDRTSGFRMFREGDATSQDVNLNFGTGDVEGWPGGVTLDATSGEWVHLAVSVSQAGTKVFMNGDLMIDGEGAVIDWTGCDQISIGSGEPNFAYWDHFSDQSLFDEMRIFNKGLTQAQVQAVMADEGQVPPYEPKYTGETFFMPFDGKYEEKISETEPTVVGTPGFAGESVQGIDAYAGAEGSYLTYPTEGLQSDEFSAAFWYKPNPEPDRAGILVAGPVDEANPDAMNDRIKGFRFFREGDGTNQTFKLNVGTGDGEAWFDGGDAATIDATTGEWFHMAFTISATESVVYINGEPVAQGEFAGIDWTGCDILSIGSGAPRFTGWDHLSDLSYIDELRLFNVSLTQEQIQGIIDDES